jgi:DNA-binding NtrC family response regulator
MTPALQAKLLQVLQDKTISRLGGHASIKIDARIIAATNVDVLEALELGELREDLYYRLNTFVISVPPLRERRDEIPFLLKYFTGRFASDHGCPKVPISRNVLEACTKYSWPGNIRELQSFVLRLLIQRDDRQTLQELQTHSLMLAAHETGRGEIAKAGPRNLKALGREIRSSAEREAISRVLLETRYNRKLAARRLKISYSALHYKMRQYGLDKVPSLVSEEHLHLETSRT